MGNPASRLSSLLHNKHVSNQLQLRAVSHSIKLKYNESDIVYRINYLLCSSSHLKFPVARIIRSRVSHTYNTVSHLTHTQTHIWTCKANEYPLKAYNVLVHTMYVEVDTYATTQQLPAVPVRAACIWRLRIVGFASCV